MSDLELLAIDVETSFVLDACGRILTDNSPDRRRGPRLRLAGCAEGNVVSLRDDVSDAAARRIAALVEVEPPLRDPTAASARTEEFAAVLGIDGPVTRVEVGLTYVLPHDVAGPHDAPLVRSGTPDGDALLARVEREGVPPGLREAGFADVDEFWPPWCIVLDGDEIAAIAFAARLGDRGAEAGLNTVAAKRGRGFGARATAGWAAHPDLADRALFYGTSLENRSSQRVAARLGLPLLGASLAIT